MGMQYSQHLYKGTAGLVTQVQNEQRKAVFSLFPYFTDEVKCMQWARCSQDQKSSSPMPHKLHCDAGESITCHVPNVSL